MKYIDIKKLIDKTAMKYAVMAVIASVVVSNLVIGGLGVVKAANEDGELTISGSARAIADLYKELAAEVGLGAQTVTWDEEVLTGLNSLCLSTDPSNNSTYQNCTREFMGTMNISSGTPTSTPLIVRNTWAQPLCFSDLKIMGIGTASSSLFAWYGTSTQYNPFTEDPISVATSTLTAQGALSSGLAIRTTLINPIITNASTSFSGFIDVFDNGNFQQNLPEVCIAEGEYFTGVIRAENSQDAATSTVDIGLTEIKVSVVGKLYSTSTQQY